MHEATVMQVGAGTWTAEPLHQPVLTGFELQEEVGRGGMGVVYRARDLALDREVAIKILKESYNPGSNTAERFLDEARITGQLQHPSIPAVYQIGQLADKRPYLAMKLIKGHTLDDLIKQKSKFDPLAIFQAISQAVGFAHAHGVLHRDLKPANIMVGAFGEVQVMDWGLAKVVPNLSASAVHPSLKEEVKTQITETTPSPTIIKTLRDSEGTQTQSGSIIGTPAYMSPEQAAGESDKIDARSDVFGLGAILCKMLTGEPPFDGDNADAVRLNAVRGRMEPALTRLNACGAAHEVIVLAKHCLAFEPTDRPVDANVVAEAVLTLRQAADDRARQAELAQAKAEVMVTEQKRRRRIWMLVAATLLVGMLTAACLSLWANQAREQAEMAHKYEALAKQEAQHKEREAKEQAALAIAVKDFLKNDLLMFASPGRQQSDKSGDVKMDPNLKVRDLVIRASKLIEGKFVDQPRTEAEIRWTLGWTLHQMGRTDLAVTHLERTLSIVKGLYDLKDSVTLSVMNELGVIYYHLGKYLEASKLFKETAELWEATYGKDDRNVLQNKYNLADCYHSLGREAEALKLHEETAQLRKSKLGHDHFETLLSMDGMANSYHTLGKLDEALKLREEIYSIRKVKLGFDNPFTLESMRGLANIYLATGRKNDALKLHEEALRLKQAKLGPDHPHTLESMEGVANSYAALGRNEEALKYYEETLRLRRTRLGPDHPHTLRSIIDLANRYIQTGKRAEATKLFEESLQWRKAKLGASHQDTILNMNVVATNYYHLNRYVEAIKLFEETTQLMKVQLGADHPQTILSMNNLAWYLATCQEEKVRDGKRAVQLATEVCEHSKWKNGSYLDTLAAACAEIGEFDKAAKYQKQALELPDYGQEDIEGGKMRLKLFESKKPYRE